MANRFYADNEALNPFDTSQTLTSLITSDNDERIAAFLGTVGEQSNTLYNNVIGVRNYESTTPLVIPNKTINFSQSGSTVQRQGIGLVTVAGDTTQPGTTAVVTGSDIFVGSVTNSAGQATLSVTQGTIGQGSGNRLRTTVFGVTANGGTNDATANATLFINGRLRTVMNVDQRSDNTVITLSPRLTNAERGLQVFMVNNVATGPAAFNMAAPGAHVFLLNSRIRIFNETTDTTFSDSYSPFFARELPVAADTFNRGSGVGNITLTNNRPGNFSSQLTSAGTHAFGSQFTFAGSFEGTRANFGLGIVENCTAINNTRGSLRYYFHANAPGTSIARQDGMTYDNRINGPNNFVNLHSGDYEIASPEFIGCAPFTNDGSAITLTGYANPSPFADAGGTRYYGVGNPGDEHGFYSINAATRIPGGDLPTAVVYNDNGAFNPRVRSALIIEASRYKPTFYSDAARATPAQAIKATINSQHSFAPSAGIDAARHRFLINNTNNANRDTDYVSDANGQLSSGNFNPLDGSTTVSFDQGLIYPTVRIVGSGTGFNESSTSSNTQFATSIALRGLFHVVDEADGIRSFQITRANQEARTDGDQDIIEGSFFPINPNLSESLQTGTHTAAAYTSHINSAFPTSGPIVRHTVQEVYDLCNRLFYDNATGIPFPVTSGNTVTFDANILLNSTVTNNTYSGNTLVLRSGGLTTALDTDNTTVYNLVDNDLNNGGGPLTANITTTGNITNVRTTATLPDDNRGTDFDLAGDINGVINLNINTNDVFLLTNLTTSTGLTINNTGNATVRIATATRPAAGATTSIANVTAGTNVEFEATDAVVNVREPIIARFTGVPAGANWKLIEFSGDEYNRIAPNAGNILARSTVNDTAARSGTVLNFRTTFPEASGSDIEVPMDQRTNAAYRGLEIAALGPGINTRVALVVTGAAISGSVSFLTLPTTFNTRATTADPNPAIGTISSVSQTITSITALGDETAVVVRVPASGNDRRAELLVSGYSNSVAGERKANPTISNAILAAARDHSNYPVAIWNAFGIGDSNSYPQNLIATGENISVPYDIINTRATNSVDIRQDTYQFFGVDSLTSSSPNLIGQGLQSVYEVQNNALLSPLELTDANRLAGLSVDNISVDAIADNSFHIRQGDASTGPETPSVISDERALTVDALAGVGITEEQVTTIVQTDGNRTRRNIPPPS